MKPLALLLALVPFFVSCNVQNQAHEWSLIDEKLIEVEDVISVRSTSVKTLLQWEVQACNWERGDKKRRCFDLDIKSMEVQSSAGNFFSGNAAYVKVVYAYKIQTYKKVYK